MSEDIGRRCWKNPEWLCSKVCVAYTEYPEPDYQRFGKHCTLMAGTIGLAELSYLEQHFEDLFEGMAKAIEEVSIAIDHISDSLDSLGK